MSHTHEYRKGRGNIDNCSCGRFQFNEKAGPPIVEQTAKHTPGPWRVAPDALSILAGREDDPTQIATQGNDYASVEDDNEAEANASLIAAAPDLLSQLKAEHADKHPLFLGFDCPSCAAIARAEGRQDA